MKRYEKLAQTVGAYSNRLKEGDAHWGDKHKQTIDSIMASAPSGAGIDCGTKLDLDASNSEKLVFTFSFHHMSEHGYYTGWTGHVARVTPSLAHGINLSITGRNRNDTKDYLHEVYYWWLKEEVDDLGAQR